MRARSLRSTHDAKFGMRTSGAAPFTSTQTVRVDCTCAKLGMQVSVRNTEGSKTLQCSFFCLIFLQTSALNFSSCELQCMSFMLLILFYSMDCFRPRSLLLLVGKVGIKVTVHMSLEAHARSAKKSILWGHPCAQPHCVHVRIAGVYSGLQVFTTNPGRCIVYGNNLFESTSE